MSANDSANRDRIRVLVEQYIQAMNENDMSGLPLDHNVVMTGPMIPTPIEGEEGVRNHLQQVAPFVGRLSLLDLVIEGDKAVAVMHYEGINGVRFEGCQYFRFDEGRITQDRVFYDTAPLLKGPDA